MAIHGWSGDCQSNSGVRGYSDIGGGGGIAVDIHGEWQSTDGPGSVKVTPVYEDTLTWGGGMAVAIHGWSGVYHSNSSVRG